MFVLPMLNHEVSRRELKALFRILALTKIAIQKAIILCRGNSVIYNFLLYLLKCYFDINLRCCSQFV